MNLNSQPIKLFLVVAFSCTSLLVSLTPVPAKSIPASSLSDAEGGLRLRSDPNGTKLRYSPCPNWFPAFRLLTHSGRLCLLFLDQRQSLSKYIPSLKTGNETTQAFGLFLMPFRSDLKTILAQATTFNQPPIPSGPPPGGRVRGGAKRGGTGCPLPKTDLTALVPFTHEANSVSNVWGQTTLEHPSWFFYVPYTKNLPSYTVEFVLQDQDSKEVYKNAIALPDKPGVIRVSLPTTAPALAVDKQYRWFFSINCDQQENSPWTYVEGVIQRVNLSQATVKELETAKPLKRYAIYAQKGIWYEALTTLAELRQKNPQDAALQAEWRKLLGSIRLDDVAGEPILPETP